MAHDASPLRRYLISAKRRIGPVQETRASAASAIVLAIRWREIGFTDVTVIDPAGQPLTPEQYREFAWRQHQDKKRGVNLVR